MPRTLVESISPQTVNSPRELEAFQPLPRDVLFPGIFSIFPRSEHVVVHSTYECCSASLSGYQWRRKEEDWVTGSIFIQFHKRGSHNTTCDASRSGSYSSDERPLSFLPLPVPSDEGSLSSPSSAYSFRRWVPVLRFRLVTKLVGRYYSRYCSSECSAGGRCSWGYWSPYCSSSQAV